MNYTLLDLISSLLAIVAFGVIVLPSAYLLAHWTDLVAFRSRTRAEQLLWVSALGLPVSLFLCNVIGRLLSPAVMDVLFLVAAVLALLVGLPGVWRARSLVRVRLVYYRHVLAALLVLVSYVLLVTTSVEIHKHLYESVNFTDWSVRLPMVDTAIRNGVPPGNPFFTVNGHPEPSRYYYYWYVLCAAVGRPFHLPARACLSASAVWSGLGLIAVLFLLLKYALRYTPKTPRQYLFPLLLCCVMGWDIVAALVGYLLRPPVINPEIEWWLDDRIPSFAGAVIFAPHHVAGVVCCAVAFLVLFVSRRATGSYNSPQPTTGWAGPAWAAFIAAVCFAACTGDSTFVVFCFTVTGILYAVDLYFQRRWVDLVALVAAGALAVVFSLPFLHDLLAQAQGVAKQHHRVLEFALRNQREKEHFAGVLVFSAGDGFWRDTLYLVIAPLFLVLQFGFLLVPLLMRIRKDWGRLRAGESLSDGERFLWVIFLGAALPGFFLSSAPQGVNDLGRHAGLILRLVMVAWAVPLLWPYLQRWRERKVLSVAHPVWARLAVLLFAVSLLSQVWQIVCDRAMLPFLAHHPNLTPGAPLAREQDSGARFFQLRQGLSQVEARLPADAVVQSNMGGPFQMLVMFYSSHPFAAGDPTCVPGFGGDERKCVSIMQDLHTLFYTSPNIPYYAHVPYHRRPPVNPALAGPDVFLKACTNQHLAAVVVQNSDLVWTVPSSWVWQLQPLYAGSLVRIFGCPAYFPESAQRVDAPATAQIIAAAQRHASPAS